MNAMNRCGSGFREPGHPPAILEGISRILPPVMLAAYCPRPRTVSSNGSLARISVFRSPASNRWTCRETRNRLTIFCRRCHALSQKPSRRFPSKMSDDKVSKYAQRCLASFHASRQILEDILPHGPLNPWVGFVEPQHSSLK